MPDTAERVRYELHHDRLEETYEIRRVETVAVLSSRDEARQHMIDTTHQRQALDAGRSRAAGMLDEFHTHPNCLPETNHPGLRETLIREETDELLDALTIANAPLTEGSRPIALRVFGIDLDAALAEIHRAAMDKMRAGVRRADGKIMKPPGFVPPDMTGALVGGGDRG